MKTMNKLTFLFGLILFSHLGTLHLLHGQSFMDRLVEIGDGFYVDAEEISNIDWKEYLFWVAREGEGDSTDFWAAHPDTSVWLGQLVSGDDAMAKIYFNHPAYDNYPLVGVSYEQAQKYCKWRADRIREVVGPGATVDLEFRLPSLAEWTLIRRLNHPDLHYKVKKKNQGKSLFNHRRPRSEPPGMANPNYLLTAPVRSFLVSEMGVYNLYGNVAEMLAEKGVAVGGSFFHSKKVIYAGINQSYTGPAHWLGFRCVAIATKKSGNLIGVKGKS